MCSTVSINETDNQRTKTSRFEYHDKMLYARQKLIFNAFTIAMERHLTLQSNSMSVGSDAKRLVGRFCFES